MRLQKLAKELKFGNDIVPFINIIDSEAKWFLNFVHRLY